MEILLVVVASEVMVVLESIVVARSAGFCVVVLETSSVVVSFGCGVDLIVVFVINIGKPFVVVETVEIVNVVLVLATKDVYITVVDVALVEDNGETDVKQLAEV